MTSKHDRITSLINATGMFLLAFLIVYLLNLFITWLTAEAFGIDAQMYYYKIEYLINYYSDLWNENSLILLFFAGPFLSVLIAAVAARLHMLYRPEPGPFKQFLLYLYLHGMNFAFGCILAGAFSHDVFWYGMAWMHIPQLIMYLLGIIGLGMLFLTGNAKAVFFIEASHYPNANNKTNRQAWLLNTLLYPWLISSLIVILVFQPELTLYYIILIATTLLLIIPVFRTSQLVNDVMTFDMGRSPGIRYTYWILAAGILAGMRLLLN